MSLQITPLAHFPPLNTYARADDVISFCNEYITKHFPFNTNDDLEHFLDMDTQAVVCRVIPFATNHDKMCKVTILSCFYFYFDDLVDQGGMELGKKSMLALLPPPGGIVTKLGESSKMSIYDLSAKLNGDIRDDMPLADYDRFVYVIKEYLRTQRMAPGYSSIEELLELRSHEAGAYLFFSFICYAMELSITEDELADPLLQQCQKLGADAAVLRNDISSYIKEVNDGSARNNVITKIQEWSNCNEDCARTQVLSKIAGLDIELHAACTQALNSSHLSADAKRFIGAIPYLLGATDWWHKHSSRYAVGRGDSIKPNFPDARK